VKDVSTSPFTIKRIPGVNLYRIKVYSMSRCGTGEGSQELRVVYYDEPKKIEDLESRAKGCAVELTWTQPADGG
jgi:hypothetical protein